MTRIISVGLAIAFLLCPALSFAQARLDELGESGELNPFDGIEVGHLSGHGNAATVSACGFVSDCVPLYTILDLETMQLFPTGRMSNVIFGLSPDGQLAGGRGMIEESVGPAIWDRHLNTTLLAESETTREIRRNHIADISEGGVSAAGTIDDRPFFWIDGDVVHPDGLSRRRTGNAVGVSNEGMTFAGTTQTSRTRQAFIWNAGDVVREIGFLEEGESSWATAISADGKVVVGQSSVPGVGTRAFRWTEEHGMEDIGAFQPTSVSGDGSVVVGNGSVDGRSAAAIWSRTSGLRSVVDVIQDYGIDAEAEGWELALASAISDDGTRILGVGVRDQRYSGWLLSVGEFEDCDLNRDGVCNAIDADALTTTSRDRILLSSFDLNEDRLVNHDDRSIWIEAAMNSYFGDANLDREFNSEDLVTIFAAGQYEDDIPMNSTWATGDWDGNGEFDSDDIVLAFQSGGYELGPRPAVAVVPEPSACLLLLVGLFTVLIGRSRSAIARA